MNRTSRDMRCVYATFAILTTVLSYAAAQYSDSGDGQYAGLGFTSVLDFLMNSDAAEVATSVAVAAASGLATSALLGNPSLVSVALIPTNQAWEDLAASTNTSVQELLADNDTLSTILSYNIIPLRTLSSMLAVNEGGAAFVTMLHNHSLRVSKMDDTRYYVRDEWCKKTATTSPIIAGRSVVMVTQVVMLPALTTAPMDCDASPPPPSVPLPPPQNPPSPNPPANPLSPKPPAPKPPARRKPPPPRRSPPFRAPSPPAPDANFITILDALRAKAPIFYAGIQAVGDPLTSLLGDGSADITVFAPVDAAFSSLKVASLTAYFNSAKWATIAKRTIVDDDAYPATNLTDKQYLDTLDPITSIRVRVDKAQVKEAWAKGISGSIEKDFGRAAVLKTFNAGSGVLYLVDTLFNKDTIQGRPTTKTPTTAQNIRGSPPAGY